MNEVSSFCDGECPVDMDYKVVDPVQMYGLRYVPGQRSLNTRTISLNGYGKDAQGKVYTQYDVHGMYGYLQSLATSKVFQISQWRRPYIISRSTAAGGGRWGSHWLGDNWSSWEYMRISIVQIMNFNFYGFPLVGADICGFTLIAWQELCDRWMQLGAFYPFMRNHNARFMPSQEPWAYDQTHLDLSRDATVLRYSLLRYMYSCYFKVHWFGGSIFRPLFFRWETDPKLYEAPEETFLFGDALMVTPVLTMWASSQKVYYPEAGTWVNLATGEVLHLATPEERVYAIDRRSLFVHLSPGSIIPY